MTDHELLAHALLAVRDVLVEIGSELHAHADRRDTGCFIAEHEHYAEANEELKRRKKEAAT